MIYILFNNTYMNSQYKISHYHLHKFLIFSPNKILVYQKK